MDEASVPWLIDTYDSRASARAAIEMPEAVGIHTTRLSLGVRGSELDRHDSGFDAGDGMKYLGLQGAIWGALWGPCLGSALFLFPEGGPLVAMGSRAGLIASAINASAVGGTAGVIAVALATVGVPMDSIAKYELELKAGRCVVVAHGTRGHVVMDV